MFLIQVKNKSKQNAGGFIKNLKNLIKRAFNFIYKK